MSITFFTGKLRRESKVSTKVVTKNDDGKWVPISLKDLIPLIIIREIKFANCN